MHVGFNIWAVLSLCTSKATSLKYISLLTVLFFNVRIEKMSLVHQEAAQKRQKQVENLLAFFYIIFSPEEFSLKWERG